MSCDVVGNQLPGCMGSKYFQHYRGPGSLCFLFLCDILVQDVKLQQSVTLSRSGHHATKHNDSIRSACSRLFER